MLHYMIEETHHTLCYISQVITATSHDDITLQIYCDM